MAGEGGSGYVTVAVSWQGMARKLECSFLVMAYSALFFFLNNIFEALNLLLIIFYTDVAELQLPGNGIRLFSSSVQSSAMASHKDLDHCM